MKIIYSFIIKQLQNLLPILPTPMERVLRELKRRRVNVSNLNALELFGYTGEYQTKDYAYFVKSLEIWEIDPSCKDALQMNFPMAKIKITDSFREIITTIKKYDFIVVDNNVDTHFGPSWEHFGLFPHIFKIMEDSAIMILNVVPDAHAVPVSSHEVSEQLEERRKFYGVSAEKISIDDMAKIYASKAREEGFTCDWCFAVRKLYVNLLVMKFRRESNI